MIDPVEQIFGEKVYVHQYKINTKSAFTGDVWQWHQDYGTSKRDDGMPQPCAMNIAIFLDEVMPINGPLMLVSRSQHQAVAPFPHAPTICREILHCEIAASGLRAVWVCEILRQLKYCRDGRVSGGVRRRRSMTGIGCGQTQPPSTM
jgi:hypothetical protein